jgi:plastocyanin
MEVEEPSGPPRGLLLGLGILGLLLAGALASLFLFKLQPAIGGAPLPVVAGVTSIMMPSNAAAVNFNPSNVTVVLGTNSTILWTNLDTVEHTVVVCPVGGGPVCPTSSAVAASPVLSKGDTFTVILNSSGVYHFYCSIHPATMRGTIVVKGGATITIPSGTAAQSLNYSPANFTVVVGVNNTVTFVNQDSTKHTVTADDGSFNSGDILPGKSWAYTFTTPGTFTFHCNYHSFMKGTVTVKSG